MCITKYILYMKIKPWSETSSVIITPYCVAEVLFNPPTAHIHRASQSKFIFNIVSFPLDGLITVKNAAIQSGKESYIKYIFLVSNKYHFSDISVSVWKIFVFFSYLYLAQ